MKTFIDKYFHKKYLFVLFALFILISCSYYLSKTYKIILFRDQNLLFLPPGFEFRDFRPQLAGVEAVGYLTDKNISPEHNDGMFLRAQWMLTPTRLDLNDPDHRYLILDCTNSAAANDIIAAVNAKILYQNSYGKILAQRIEP